MKLGRKMIVRVFARKTNATPIDSYAFYSEPEEILPKNITEVHVSVTFTWDIERAEYLAKAWKHIAPAMIGGPATGMRGGEFEPGRYLKSGYVITSRGCPNKCWFCDVWRREGGVRELPIRLGNNVLDDNLLACSEKHVRAVFKMLKAQKGGKEFTGGLEAARLKDWHIDLLADLKPKQIFFAYDTSDDYEPLVEAGKKLQRAGLGGGRRNRCFVLIGFPSDTFVEAEKRLWQTVDAGFFPMAMLYRDKLNRTEPAWRKLQRPWARPASIYAMIKARKGVRVRVSRELI